MLIEDIYKEDEVRYGYVALRPDPQSASKLVGLLQSVGISDGIPANELHSTLMYDVKNSVPHSKLHEVSRPDAIYDDIELEDIIILGNAVVVTYSSQSIIDRFKELSKHMKHSYDENLLHMSFKYSDNTEEDLKKIKEYKKEIFTTLSGLTFYAEYFEPLKDD